MESIDKLAKSGDFEALLRREADVGGRELAVIFERAVTDFRTVKRNRGHQRILEWCIEEGLDFEARAGWLNQTVVCLAAAHGNNEIMEVMTRKGIPDDPFTRASVGDLDYLKAYASRHDLSGLKDVNGFNVLFNCAQSGLGRRDAVMKRRLTDVCEFLLEQGVRPADEVTRELPIFPAFLCASSGGNEDIMRLLLEHGGLSPERFHQVLEHTLEPHQRSGEPFEQIALLVLQQGYDVNAIRPDQGRTLLHGAAHRGTIKAVQWLLQNGADPNVHDSVGRTPLHMCAERNRSVAVAQLLIEAGAEWNAKDAAGRTPLDAARENARERVVEYLESIGGR